MNHKTSLLNDLQHEHDQLDQLTQRNGLLAKDWFDKQERIKQKANELKELQEEYIELKRRVKIQKELSSAIIEHGLDAIEEYNRLSKHIEDQTAEFEQFEATVHELSQQIKNVQQRMTNWSSKNHRRMERDFLPQYEINHCLKHEGQYCFYVT